MDAKAQTIVQLLNQLQHQQYPTADLRLVHRAYEFAVAACTCQLRSSGRTLIDHSIGSASLLATQGAQPALVAAGVIHAAYIHGDFGTWRKRIGQHHRARMQRAVGSATEEIVYQYSCMDRRVQTLTAMRDGLGRLDAMQRDLILLRLADLLDIYGERDALYCDNLDRRREVARRFGTASAGVADALGFPSLAAALIEGFHEVEDDMPASAITPPWKDGVILPRSYRTRLSIALYQRARTKIYRMTGR